MCARSVTFWRYCAIVEISGTGYVVLATWWLDSEGAGDFSVLRIGDSWRQSSIGTELKQL